MLLHQSMAALKGAAGFPAGASVAPVAKADEEPAAPVKRPKLLARMKAKRKTKLEKKASMKAAKDARGSAKMLQNPMQGGAAAAAGDGPTPILLPNQPANQSKQAFLAEVVKSGSTAVTLLIRGRTYSVAWAGDARAVLCRGGSAVALTSDHKPNRPDERRRIEAAGGSVDSKARLFGDLAVSRAFGDMRHKSLEVNLETGECGSTSGPLIASPEVTQLPMDAADEFVVLASDGTWDVLSNQEAVNFVRRHLVLNGDAQAAAAALVDKAFQMGSGDNLSAVVVCVNQGE